MQALCVNEFKDRDSFSCPPAPVIEAATDPAAAAAATPAVAARCIQGNDLLKQLEFHDVEIFHNVLVLVGGLVLFNAIAFAVLVWCVLIRTLASDPNIAPL